MNSGDFYVTLTSNDGGAYYATNTLTHFRNKLPETIHLQEGQWEVGLVECILPFNSYHISDDDGEMKGTKYIYKEGIISAQEHKKFSMAPGRYRSALRFVQILGETLAEFKLGAGFPVTFDQRTRKAKLEVPAVTSLLITRRMMAILDFDEKAETVEKQLDGRFKLNTGVYKSQGTVDLLGGLHTLWIYSDIVEHRIVAERKLPLLRIVTTEDKIAVDYKHLTFEDAHYFPVRQTLFESIEIDIRDSQGFPVPFEAGEAVVTLHFRQRH